MTHSTWSRATGIALLAAVTAWGSPSPADAALNAYNVAATRISPDVVAYGGELYVPLADLGRATGCAFTRPDGQAHYGAQACSSGGLLEVNGPALAGYGGPNAKRGGPPQDDSDTKGWNPQPDPPVEARIDGIVLSRRVLHESQQAFVPLADVATAMSAKIQRQDTTARLVVKRTRSAQAPLRVNPDRA